LFEHSRELIYVHDFTGRFIDANNRALASLGYTREQIAELNFGDLLSPEQLPEAMQAAQHIFEHGVDTGVHLYRLKTHDGRTIWVECTGVRIDKDGKPCAALGVARDVTDRILAEKEKEHLQAQLLQSQKMEAVGRLAGGVAHDFNNLLTIITGYCDMALKAIDEQNPLHKTISTIKQAGERAAGLTRQLLAFSRRQVFNPKLIDLNTVVSDSKIMLGRLIGENIDFHAVLGPALNPILADPGLIGQVIMNLAVNARDAMPDGGTLSIITENVELSLEFAREHPEFKPGPYVILAISDTGCGMTEDVKKHLFEPFFTTKGIDKGSGLGLSTVYGIVKQSNGHISVYTEPDHGTTFRIYFPVAQNLNDTLLSGQHKEAVSEKGSETILVVEDESGVRELIVDVLMNAGYTVLAAPDGEKAEKLCKKHTGPLHLLVTDMVLPRMSGRDVAQKLAQYRPDAKVLFMSGYTDDVIFHSGALDPDMAFIEKPFSPDVFLRKVREVLDS